MEVERHHTMSVLEAITTDRFYERSLDLAREVGQLAIQSKSIEVDSPDGLVVRDLLPGIDLESGAANGWAGDTNEWVQNFATNGTADDWNQAYVINSDAKAEGKVIGLLAFTLPHADVVTTEQRFQKGKNGTQGVKRLEQIESIVTDDEGRGVYVEDVIFGAKESGTIDHYITAAEDGKQVVYAGFVGEPVAETLSEPTNPLLGQDQMGR